MKNLPKGLEFLQALPKTRMLMAAFALYGVQEISGQANNPVILGWAKELGINEYKQDKTAWCGLFQAYICKEADKPPCPTNPLWALNWAKWGQASLSAEWGDTLVFERRDAKGKFLGGHVGLYLCESKNFYYVLGGNTNDKVGIAKISKKRLVAVRRSYNVVPSYVKPIFVKDEDINLKISSNEA